MFNSTTRNAVSLTDNIQRNKSVKPSLELKVSQEIPEQSQLSRFIS